MILYYPDRLEYFVSNKSESGEEEMSYRSMRPNTIEYGENAVAENPYGIVPVFHFRRERRGVVSELQNVVPPQDAVNKLLADMMIAAEFGAFPQRWIISQTNTEKMKNAPNQIWDLPGSDGEGQQTSAGQFPPTDLSNYIGAIDRWANSIAAITRTPKHYFFQAGGTPSGEALIAMEAPLNHKAQRYIDRLVFPWRRLAHFMLLLSGGGGVALADVMPVFDKPETVQPWTQAQIRKVNVESGIPLETQLRMEGWDEQQIGQMQEDAQTAQERENAGLGTAMANAMRQFDQNEE